MTRFIVIDEDRHDKKTKAPEIGGMMNGVIYIKHHS
jgi:hypothetical protein